MIVRFVRAVDDVALAVGGEATRLPRHNGEAIRAIKRTMLAVPNAAIVKQFMHTRRDFFRGQPGVRLLWRDVLNESSGSPSEEAVRRMLLEDHRQNPVIVNKAMERRNFLVWCFSLSTA